jgi:hypothetical protein
MATLYVLHRNDFHVQNNKIIGTGSKRKKITHFLPRIVAELIFKGIIEMFSYTYEVTSHLIFR